MILRRLSIPLLTLLAASAAGVLVAMLWLPRTAPSAVGARQVNRSVVWAGGEITTTLTLSPTLGASCAERIRPLDVALLLDSSAAMQGAPLRAATAAAHGFIEQVDLGVQHVALIRFADWATTVQELTADRGQLLAALEPTTVGGEAALDAALAAARAELGSPRRRTEAGALVLIIANSVSPAEPVQHEVALLREQGVQIGVASLREGTLDELGLREVATSPTTFWLAETPEALAANFRALASELNQVVATNVQVVEPVTPAFEVLTPTIAPPGLGMVDGIRWQIGWLSRSNPSEMNEGMRLMYRVRARQAGLQRLAAEGAAVRFVDCTGAPGLASGRAGPQLLVLPAALAWLAPALALLALLPFAGIFGRFRRQGTPRQGTPRAEPQSLAPPVPDPAVGGPGYAAPAALRDWLKRTERWAAEGKRASSLRERPALFIGLDASGGAVLAQVADYLDARCGRQWPTHIRLVQVNVGDDGARHNNGSERYPTVILNPDLGRLRLDQVRWYAGDRARPGRGRDLGRLALFADLMRGQAKSHLWPVLVGGLGDLKGISVYVVADAFDDAGSSMIADIAHLIRTLAASEQVNRVALFLAMQHSRWPDTLTPARRSERVFATVRELRRMQRSVLFRFPYAPGLGLTQLDAASKGPLFDEIVLFDGISEGNPPALDYSQLPSEQGLLPAMAGALIALLDRSISEQFYQMWANEVARAQREGQQPFENFVSAMGSYALRLPVEEMRRVFECRLVHRFLFDRCHGALGWEELGAEGEPVERGTLPGEPPTEFAVSEFLRERFAGGHPAGAPTFQGQVLDYLELQMNHGGGPRLRWAAGFIQALRQALPEREAELAPVAQALEEWSAAVSPAAPAARTIAKTTVDDFLGRRETIKRSTGSLPEGPLYQAWKAQWKWATRAFDQAASMQAQRLLWSRSREQRLFEEYIEPQQPEERIREVVWWRWSSSERGPRLRLLILPRQLDAPDPDNLLFTRRQMIERSPDAFTLGSDQTEQIVARLLELAAAFSRALLEARLVLEPAETEMLARELVQRSTPLYREEQVGLGQMAVVPFRYFAAPSSGGGPALGAAVQALLDHTGRLQPLGTGTPSGRETRQFFPVTRDDQSDCWLLQVEHMLWLPALKVYHEAQQAYTPRAELHVFEPEQAAARWEERAASRLARDAGRLTFSPAFVELLAGNEEALRLFGLAVVYGLVTLDPTTHRVTVGANEVLEMLEGLEATRAAERFARDLAGQGTMAAQVRTALEQCRPDDYNQRMELLDTARERLAIALSQRDEPEVQDLSLLLAAVIAEEQRAS